MFVLSNNPLLHNTTHDSLLDCYTVDMNILSTSHPVSAVVTRK